MKGLLFLALTANLSFSLAQATVTLGTASTYGALSYASITNTGPTDITGDIGTTGTSITGFPPGTYSGSKYLGSQAVVALEDAEAAYQAVAALPGAVLLTGNLGGRQLGPGTYKYSASAQLTGILTLVGTGSPNDAWYFQIGSTLTTAVGSAVQILAGGQPCNVFWKVGSSATIGLGTEFAGNILAAVSITMNGESSIQGGVVALGASIMLNSNLILAQGTCPSTTSSSSSSSLSSSFLAASSTSSSSSIVSTTDASSSTSSSPNTSSSSSSLASSSTSSSSIIASTTEASSSTSSSPNTSSSSALATQSSMSIGVSSSNPSSSSSSSASRSPTPTANSSTASSSTSSTSSSVSSLSSAFSSSSLSTSVISTISSSVSSNSSTILPSTRSNTTVGPVLPVTSSTTSSVFNGSTTGLATTSSSAYLSTTATCSGPSSVPSVTTSTVYTVRTYTVTSCAPTVTNCPALIGKITTETISLYTTVCPISSAIRLETAVPSSYTSPVVPTNTSGGAFNPLGPVALSTTIAPLVVTTSKVPATGIATASATAYTAAAPKVAEDWALEGAVAIVVAMML